MLSPAAVPLAAIAPTALAVGAGAGYAVEEGTRGILKWVGVDDDTADVVGAILGLFPIGVGVARGIRGYGPKSDLARRIASAVDEAKVASTDMGKVRRPESKSIRWCGKPENLMQIGSPEKLAATPLLSQRRLSIPVEQTRHSINHGYQGNRTN